MAMYETHDVSQEEVQGQGCVDGVCGPITSFLYPPSKLGTLLKSMREVAGLTPEACARHFEMEEGDYLALERGYKCLTGGDWNDMLDILFSVVSSRLRELESVSTPITEPQLTEDDKTYG